MKSFEKLIFMVFIGAQVFSSAIVVAADNLPPECGGLANAYGPFDYSIPENRANKLPIVEKNHFTSVVETLKHGQSSDNIAADIDYTLRAFPNHPRALYAMARYQLMNDRPPNAKYYQIECYFLRAMAFTPTDGVVRMIYGIYLHKKGDYKGALQRYNEAIDLVPESSEAHYNLGLLYVDIKKYPEALAEAKHAYTLGYPLPGLRQRLIEVGAWNDAQAKPVKNAPGNSASDKTVPTP